MLEWSLHYSAPRVMPLSFWLLHIVLLHIVQWRRQREYVECEDPKPERLRSADRQQV